jgi:hypothetical protein
MNRKKRPVQKQRSNLDAPRARIEKYQVKALDAVIRNEIGEL